jgi:hypothetical protein
MNKAAAAAAAAALSVSGRTQAFSHNSARHSWGMCQQVGAMPHAAMTQCRSQQLIDAALRAAAGSNATLQ